MALIPKRSAEEKAARRVERESSAREQAIEKARRAFYRTPAGQARRAYDRGDQVFQYAADVMHQSAIIVAMVGSTTAKRTRDPVAILNSVCNEGWELVNGSFTFVEQGQQSRDKFLSSGQNVAVKGTVMGFYLFRRCDANRLEETKPWEATTVEETDDE